MTTHGIDLQKILDRNEITDQISRYCHFFDSNNPTELRKLFTFDAQVDYGPEVPTLVGIDVIMQSISKGLSSTFIATSHHISNVLVQFESHDVARASSYVYAWHRYYSKPEIGYLWGQYSHTFRKELDGWKISSLQLRAVAVQDFHRESMHPVERGK